MVTTIQLEDRTLTILKKLKEETNSSSYDEAINRVIADHSGKQSMAGFLGKMPVKGIMKNLREKNERV